MSDPAGLVAALGGDVFEHRVPASLGFRIGGRGAGAAVTDEAEFAITDGHGASRWFRHIPAHRAWFTGDADGAALCAAREFELVAAVAARGVGWAPSLAVGIERPY